MRAAARWGGISRSPRQMAPPPPPVISVRDVSSDNAAAIFLLFAALLSVFVHGALYEIEFWRNDTLKRDSGGTVAIPRTGSRRPRGEYPVWRPLYGPVAMWSGVEMADLETSWWSLVVLRSAWRRPCCRLFLNFQTYYLGIDLQKMENYAKFRNKQWRKFRWDLVVKD